MSQMKNYQSTLCVLRENIPLRICSLDKETVQTDLSAICIYIDSIFQKKLQYF